MPRKIHISTSKTRQTGKAHVEEDQDIISMMMDPRYLKQSSVLVHESLQKGYDVLQLADGSIVTTGPKTIICQYSWDAEKAKLVRVKKTEIGPEEAAANAAKATSSASKEAARAKSRAKEDA